MGRATWQLGDDELFDKLRGSQDQLNELYGVQLELLAEVQARGLVAASGYGSASRLVQDLLRISRGEANRRLAHAAAVTGVPAVSGQAGPPPLPATAEAVLAGAISPEHIEAIRRVITALPPQVDPEEREQAEQTLVQAARTLDPGAVAALGRTLQAVLDQDGRPPSDAEPRTPVNELRWHTRANGEVEFKGRLGVEGGALLTTVLSPLAKPRPATDGQPDPRTRAERYGDALVEALRLALDSGQLPTEAGERPTLLITMSLDNLRNQTQPALLSEHTRIHPGLARRLACDSAVIPAVLGSQSEPLDIGRKTRIIPAAIRRALVLRDRGCTFPGCPVPANWCAAHHCHHWADGGATALSNLALLCGPHHALIHDSDWELTIPNGIPEFIPPAYLDSARTPRRNPIHHPPHPATSDP